MEAPFQTTAHLSMSFLLLQHIITLFCNYIFSKPSVLSAWLRAPQRHEPCGPYLSSYPQQPAQRPTQSEHWVHYTFVQWMNGKLNEWVMKEGKNSRFESLSSSGQGGLVNPGTILTSSLGPPGYHNLSAPQRDRQQLVFLGLRHLLCPDFCEELN